MNGKMKKLLALLLVLCLSLGCLAACGQSGAETQPETDPVDDAIVQAASELLPNHGDTAGKEETVYVIANANGKPERTIVSAWLKNPEEADTITDRSDLSGIENVKGDESFTKAADGSLVWDAKGSDIYYQGDSKQELPLEVHVSYKLDGKEVKPEELSGASGHLEMTFSYENKASRQEKIGGEDVTVYQPFFVVSCLVLDASKASAVEVTNGTTINSGEQVIVAGMAMPGLKESLGLDELEDADGETLDADLPDTVTINADVTDFSLLTSLTLVENALLNDLDLDNVEGFDDLKSSINKLVDASSQLVNGAGDLYDGTKTLSDGTGELTAGTAELSAGAKAVSDGANQLRDGLSTASEEIAPLIGTLNTYSEQLSGLSTDQLDAAVEGLGVADKALGDIQTKLESAASDPLNISGLTDQFTVINNVLTDAKDAASTLADSHQKAITELETIKTKAAEIGDEEQRAEIQKAIDAAIAELNGSNDKKETLAHSASDLSDAKTALSTGANALTAKAKEKADGLIYAAAGVQEVINGKEGQQGVIDVVENLQNIEEIKDLPDMVSGLNKQAGDLVSKLGTAVKGSSDLADGAKALSEGAASLDTGAKELDGGVKQVMNGASSLLDGLRTFDGDGVKVLSRLFEQDAQGFMDRLRAVQAYGEEYDNFSGLAEGMPGTVRFVIRTDSIGE